MTQWLKDGTLWHPARGPLIAAGVPPPPTLASVSPAFSDEAGGDTVTFTVTSVVNAATIGGVACTSVVQTSPTTVTAVVPAGLAIDTHDVQVSGPGGSSNVLTDGFEIVIGLANAALSAKAWTLEAALANVVLASGKVQTWTDGVYSATENTAANQPLWDATGGHGGGPTLVGNGGPTRLTIGSAPAFGASFTLFLVLSVPPPAQSVMIKESADAYLMLQKYATNKIEHFTGTDRETFVDTASSGWRVITTRQTDGVSLIGRSNGVEVFSKVPTVALAARIPSVLMGYDGASFGVSNKLAAAYLIKAALSDANVLKVERRLSLKFGSIY